MGLDMYLISTRKNPQGVRDYNIIQETARIMELDYIIPKYSFEKIYHRKPMALPDGLQEFYTNLVKEIKDKDTTFDFYYTLEAYWRKDYQMDDYLRKFTIDKARTYSRPLNQTDIELIKKYAKELLDKIEKPEPIKIVGYVDASGKQINLPKTTSHLIVAPIFSENTLKVDRDTTFYTSLPFEYLEEDDDDEVSKLVYTVKKMDRILKEFDFTNNLLFYIVSY